MPKMTMERPERDFSVITSTPRHFTHKRLERWIRLQQFVYGLPDDYAYAVCTTDLGTRAESRVLVNVGWMTWFGHGRGSSRQHSLALALLESSEAISSNGTRVLFHRVSRFVRGLRPGSLRARVAQHSEQKKLAS